MGFSFANRMRPAQHVLVRELESESVLLNLNTESYYGLDDVATRMWSLLMSSECIQDCYELLAKEFDVPEEQLRIDLGKLIADLIAYGLVEIEKR